MAEQAMGSMRGISRKVNVAGINRSRLLCIRSEQPVLTQVLEGLEGSIVIWVGVIEVLYGDLGALSYWYRWYSVRYMVQVCLVFVSPFGTGIIKDIGGIGVDNSVLVASLYHWSWYQVCPGDVIDVVTVLVPGGRILVEVDSVLDGVYTEYVKINKINYIVHGSSRYLIVGDRTIGAIARLVNVATGRDGDNGKRYQLFLLPVQLTL